MKIELSNSLLDKMDLGNIKNVPEYYKPYFNKPSGVEHYRLLIHLGYSFNDIIISDIGTHRGCSALALAQNQKNKIFSVDIKNIRENDIGLPNVEFCVGNFETDKNIQEKILQSTLISLDIDHEYTHEIWMYNFLTEKNWNGVMVCDDINLFGPMNKFWSEIKHKKIDITKYGHGSGTGVIIFCENFEFDLK